MERNKLRKSIAILFFAVLFFSAPISYAQSHFPGMFLVSFTDKNQSPYDIKNPEKFLSAKAIDRRQKAAISIIDQDLPANPHYIDSIGKYGAKASFSSRWLNAVLVRMDDSLKMELLKQLGFVDSVAYMAPVKSKSKHKSSKQHSKRVVTTSQEVSVTVDYGESYDQQELIGLPDLHKLGFHGEGMQIAVLDNGFKGMNKMPVFDNFFDNGQLLGTKDIANPGGDVFKAGSHGTYVMTMMAAFQEGLLVGTAPAASYLLIHTEDNTYEYPIEEFNWAIGAEFADSAGVDIITSSLIYSLFDDTSLNHTHAQLNGKTAIISRAAQIATEKGILVFNSAGNDAKNAWHKIAFPADAKDVMTIGAVDMQGVYAPFSSLGYTVDGRVKPDVTAVGKGAKSVSISTGKIIGINGTSFSNPTMAGATAILRQANPDASTEEIRQAIRQSATRYEFPDSLMGYGIPNFYLAHVFLNNKDIERIKEIEGFTLMPNPYIDDLFVLFNIADSQKVDFSIVDVNGRIMWERLNVPCTRGINIIKISELAGFPQGMYVVIMKAGDKTFTKKLVK